MSTYSNRLQPALQNLFCCSVLSPEIVMPDALYLRTKITRKASDVAEYIELFGSFTQDSHAQLRIYWQTFRE